MSLHEYRDLTQRSEEWYEARKRCATCPVLRQCRQLLHQETSNYPWGGSGPVGTWAGELLGTTRRKKATT